MQKIVSILFFFLTGVSWAVSPYDFPQLSSLESTITVTNLKGEAGEKVKYGPSHMLEVSPGYTGPFRYYYRLYQARGRAPLIFLHVGLGGAPEDGSNEFLAELLHNQGYHVVVLGSTFRDDFAVLAASSPYVGQARIDAYDLYRKMIGIKGQLLERGLQVSHWGLTGYSFGALVSAFVAQLNDREKYFDFSKVVLINPPVDLLYSMGQLDEYYDDFASKKGVDQAAMALRFAQYSASMKSKEFNLENHVYHLRKANLGNSDLRGLIGAHFRRTLNDVVFYSQQADDLGVIPVGVSNERKQKAKKYGYYDYVALFVSRFLQETFEGRLLWNRFYGEKNKFSLSLLNKSNSLYSVEKTFKSNRRIVLFHNTDDFLVRREDIDFLRRSLGNRFFLFPAGGHLGHLWFEPFQERYLGQWQLAFQ